MSILKILLPLIIQASLEELFTRTEINYKDYTSILNWLSGKGTERQRDSKPYESVARTLALPKEIKDEIENAKDINDIEAASADIKDIAIEGVPQELDALLEKKTEELLDKETDLEILDTSISTITDGALKEKFIRKEIALAETAATESREEALQNLENLPGRLQNRLLIRASRFEDLNDTIEAPTNASLNARGFIPEEYDDAREDALTILESKGLTTAAEQVRRQLG